jgi:hypothetical protein
MSRISRRHRRRDSSASLAKRCNRKAQARRRPAIWRVVVDAAHGRMTERVRQRVDSSSAASTVARPVVFGILRNRQLIPFPHFSDRAAEEAQNLRSTLAALRYIA